MTYFLFAQNYLKYFSRNAAQKKNNDVQNVKFKLREITNKNAQNNAKLNLISGE